MIIKIKKLTNHWYVDIAHGCLSDIALSNKIERFLNKIDKMNYGEVNIGFIPLPDLSYSNNSINFDTDDLFTFLTTDEDFDIRFYINNKKFYISSYLFFLLEEQYSFNFYKTLYKINIW